MRKRNPVRIFGYAAPGAHPSSLAPVPVPPGSGAPSLGYVDRGPDASGPVAYVFADDPTPPVLSASTPDGSFLALDGHVVGVRDESAAMAKALQSFLAHGEAALEHLEFTGFLVGWDARAERLVLVRDRYGVAPAYYAEYAGGVAFASDLTTLIRVGHPADVDEVGMAKFLDLGFLPAPATPIRGIRKIPPAHTITVTPGGVIRDRHWGGDSHEPVSIPDEAAHEAFRDHFVTALRRRWSPGETTGLLLSGGVDSAMILAGLRRILDADVRSFTFRYADYEGQFNEGDQARRIAAHLGAPHEEIVVSPDRLWSDLDRAVLAYGEPARWGLHSYLLEPLTSAGVTSLFSGAGPDGWVLPKRYRAALRLKRMPRVTRSALRIALAATAPIPNRRIQKMRSAVQEAESLAELFFPANPAQSLLHRTVYRDPELARRARESSLEILRRAVDDYRDHSDERILILLGKRFTSAESVLYWNTAWSRAYGLPLRLPYFDRELVDLVFALRGPLTGKDRVRALAAEYLPRDLAYAPKIPQEIPIGHWLRGPLAARARERLEAIPAALSSIFDPAGIRRVFEEHVTGRADRGWTIVSLITMMVWCEGLERLPSR